MSRRQPTERQPVLTDGEWSMITTQLALTPRQIAIVRELLTGKSDKQIVRCLRMSLPTLRTHLSRLFDKTGCEDRVGLVLIVFRIALEVARSRGHQN